MDFYKSLQTTIIFSAKNIFIRMLRYNFTLKFCALKVHYNNNTLS